MFWKLLLLALAALPLIVESNSTPTHCDRWRGNSEFRCAKRNYGIDSIHIRNIVNGNISFGIEKWMSECGRHGVRYSLSSWRLGPGGSMDHYFGESQGLACNEFFINSCQLEGRIIDCVQVLTPSVNLNSSLCR